MVIFHEKENGLNVTPSGLVRLRRVALLFPAKWCRVEFLGVLGDKYIESEAGASVLRRAERPGRNAPARPAPPDPGGGGQNRKVFRRAAA